MSRYEVAVILDAKFSFEHGGYEVAALSECGTEEPEDKAMYNYVVIYEISEKKAAKRSAYYAAGRAFDSFLGRYLRT